MPSFDTVCEPNLVEVKNAVENTAKEIGTRFDFKGTSAAVELKDKEITLFGDAEFQLGQVEDILRGKLTKRSVDVRFLDKGDVQKIGGDKVKQVIKVKSGIESRDRQEDPAPDQGQQAQGAGRDPGRRGARHRRQARRPAGRDGADQEGRAGHAAVLQQLPRLSCHEGAPPHAAAGRSLALAHAQSVMLTGTIGSRAS